jgi:hypothetical protein
MIQRIQSVYLLLSSLFFTFFLLFPVFKVTTEAGVIAEKAMENTYFFVLAVILVVGCLGNVFLYKNRVLQKNVGWLLFVLNLFLAGIMGYHFYLEQRAENMVSISFGAIFPIITLVLILLAIYNINKDEKLVRSLDRLR